MFTQELNGQELNLQQLRQQLTWLRDALVAVDPAEQLRIQQAIVEIQQ